MSIKLAMHYKWVHISVTVDTVHENKQLTSRASMTVPTPTVRALVGTFDISPSKNRALAMIVSCAKVLIRVLDTRLEPGSLKAIWPSGPIPVIEQ